MDINNLLTEEDMVWLQAAQVAIDRIDGEAPRSRPDVPLVPSMIPSLLVGPKLSAVTRRAEERRMEKREQKRKSLRERKKYTRRVGTVHPKKKEATKRRNRKKLWRTQPYRCVTHSYGYYKIEEALWNKYIAPLWERYIPEDLEVKRHEKTGTRANPCTIYTIDVVHKELGRLYDGNAQLIYDMSCNV